MGCGSAEKWPDGGGLEGRAAKLIRYDCGTPTKCHIAIRDVLRRDDHFTASWHTIHTFIIYSICMCLPWMLATNFVSGSFSACRFLCFSLFFCFSSFLRPSAVVRIRSRRDEHATCSNDTTQRTSLGARITRTTHAASCSWSHASPQQQLPWTRSRNRFRGGEQETKGAHAQRCFCGRRQSSRWCT